MRASKKIIVWASISLVVQLSVYFYLDRFYFGEENNIKISNMGNFDTEKEIKPNVAVPSSASDITISDDGSYTAYMENSIVKVFDTNTGKQLNLNFVNGVQCLAYRWVPDTNRMIIAENVSGQLRFYSYNAEKKYKEEVKDYINGKSNVISASRRGTEVNMRMSVSTGVMYIKVSYAGAGSRVYRLDVDEELTQIRTLNNQIGRFNVTSREDNLIYEDSINGTVRSTKIKNNIVVDGNASLKFLGVDENNNVYVSARSGKINKIYYGEVAAAATKFKTVNLDGSYDSDNIFISSGGNIYFKDLASSRLINLKNNTKYQYKGTFEGLFNNRIASVSGGKLVLQKID
ncbi:hypothetical protein BJV85_001258 [Clostridium acetobutylicum]|uniref:Uncharacterized protein n=1 Tax=Clostridium acetobutylicum (strain ATCC 824 / DSM 792 / JCM 1419 / IAM 19013 / LMG 5710 / NBRC 13948 / NRRL B-527 / VKM B-1787 / 2291 / W) TaxID=272562 RepID=Q97FU4_CLOAB|nr:MULTISPECIES: hypothetical protein [Clostridium]AAK80579.1 Hypothetical protein CA_C2632 [Clostridium acetobutylicum ATCC 824]ADZ21678.1 Conserved hypothetical protein [Clostridium acetobutylicum EA 2018]AEI32477.1 hypothetical protein SMB_G2667 [Clostridium acetobutylicum DSM 1731]AWV79004.1 hypothetical protein DK921_02595 [Clostridium acetobutylicum]MBC2395036.1 hypothetical protein [Clostridium acetobutylicum]